MIRSESSPERAQSVYSEPISEPFSPTALSLSSGIMQERNKGSFEGVDPNIGRDNEEESHESELNAQSMVQNAFVSPPPTAKKDRCCRTR